ncbi:hypothetical protein AVO42_08120 [Thiomicrospira sp. XS5]|uniref:hypothetical protein n=1 Tax=Thiomicrospira sp. XS5 TaxID=1775636 RepID=UPI0007498E72|nr:hypothetical protein [Thiomicrospira sp. XS5]KUJ75289.1 hypothetical protein AVO42_08120 [Thiomicrospira sp. XS5]
MHNNGGREGLAFSGAFCALKEPSTQAPDRTVMFSQGVEMSFTFYDIEGSHLIANDGEFIGQISGEFDEKSIINEFGPHGGEFNDKSISNEFCNYGGEFSDLSPYNEFSQTPPRLIKGNKVIAYVTKNEFLSPRIDPDVLLAMTKREAI